MAKEKKFPISGKSFLLLFIGTTALLAFVLVVILPSQAALQRKGREITAKEAELQERKILYPIYTDLIGRLQAKENRTLPFPEAAALTMEEVNIFLNDFKGMAKRRDMDLLLIIPDFTTMSERPDMLTITATLKGRFGDFRNFLKDLGETAALTHIEEVQINSVPGFKEFRVKFRLVLKT